MNTLQNRRILLIDDTLAIHEDFRKILMPLGASAALDVAELELFGAVAPFLALGFELDFAFQGEEGLAIGAERGRITICTGLDNERIWIEVSDTGCGTARENLSRIFDPFFTTQPVGKVADWVCRCPTALSSNTTAAWTCTAKSAKEAISVSCCLCDSGPRPRHPTHPASANHHEAAHRRRLESRQHAAAVGLWQGCGARNRDRRLP